MSNRRPLIGVSMALAVTLLAAGCSSRSSQAAPPELLPSKLIGAWDVAAEDVPEGSKVRIGDPAEEEFFGWDATLDLGSCVVGLRMAAARPNLFAWQYTSSQGDDCGQVARGFVETPPALLRASTFAAAPDGGITLRDQAGVTLATLTPTGSMRTPDGTDPRGFEVPTASVQGRAEFDRVVEIPDDLVPAAPADLIGSWRPQQARNAGARLKFVDDGTFRGSDGCNGVFGRWSMESDTGALVTTPPGFTTLIGCRNSGVPGAVHGARFAGFDGNVLVLTDASGTELARFVDADEADN
jgi:hypothetical protein